MSPISRTILSLAVVFPILGLAGTAAAEGKEFELGATYGVSFQRVRHDIGKDWGWGEGHEKLGGSFVQGLSLGTRLGDHVLAEVSFAVAPGREFDTGSVFAPWACVYSNTECPTRCGGEPGSPECVAPPLPYPQYYDWERVVSYEYGVNVAVDLAGKDLVPFISLGAGGVTYAFDDRTTSDLRLSLGVGIRRYFGRVGVRLELLDFVSTDSFLSGDVEHDPQVRAGLQVRLP